MQGDNPHIIVIRGVREDHGWLGNMSRYPIAFEGRTWRTAEALFQALRFQDESIRAAIHEIDRTRSPMAAKFFAKARVAAMAVAPMSALDIENMRRVLRLKLEQHSELTGRLLRTGDVPIIEDCTRRPRGSGLFWGAALVDGAWVGENRLGKLWMELRDELRSAGGHRAVGDQD